MKFSFLPRWDQFQEQIRRVAKHYPLTMAICIAVAALLYWSVAFETGFFDNLNNEISRNILALTLLVPLTFAIRNEARNRSLPLAKELVALALGAALVLWIRLTVFTPMFTPGMLAFASGLFGFIFLSLAATRLDPQATTEQNVVTFVTSILVSALYSFVLMIGLFIIFASIQFLFDVNVNKWFPYSAIFCIVLCFPFLFLARMTPETIHTEYPTILRQTVLYIIVPLSIVYFLILYVYAVQFILAGTWERSIASNLIIWFGMFCIFLDLLVHPLRENHALAKHWSRWTPVALVPLLIFALITMNMRIGQYSWTELRYLAIVLAAFALLVQLAKIIIKRVTNRAILVALSALLLIVTVGPLSASHVSLRAQTKRLEEYLLKHEMLKEGQIIPNASVPTADQAQITDILRYLEYNHASEAVAILPDDFTMDQMKSIFGFSAADPYHYNTESYLRRVPEPLPLNDYQFIIKGIRDNAPITAGDYSFQYYQNGQNQLILRKGNDELTVVDLKKQPIPSQESLTQQELDVDAARVPFAAEGIRGEVVIWEGYYDTVNQRWGYVDFSILYSISE